MAIETLDSDDFVIDIIDDVPAYITVDSEYTYQSEARGELWNVQGDYFSGWSINPNWDGFANVFDLKLFENAQDLAAETNEASLGRLGIDPNTNITDQTPIPATSGDREANKHRWRVDGRIPNDAATGAVYGRIYLQHNDAL